MIINNSTIKYEHVEDEGREIQCSDGEEIRYYDKEGNYIMSERDKVEEEEDDDDDTEDDIVDEIDGSESDDVDFDQDAICIYYFSQTMTQ